ncbi:ComEA family DNA-binding protein [Nocardia camponoti]|nr:ComEA family DNA-binding protein [Nocardia camponoti]
MTPHDIHHRVRERLGGLTATVAPAPWERAVSALRSTNTPGQQGKWDDEESSAGDVRSPAWLDDGPASRKRIDPGKRGVLALAAVACAAIVVTAIMILWQRPSAQSVPPVPSSRSDAAEARHDEVVPVASVGDSPPAHPRVGETAAEIVVSVVGAVERGGIHHLPAGARVADAIEAAGGTLSGIDLAGLNLAQRLTDGDQVVVGTARAPTGGAGTASTVLSGGAVAGDGAPGPAGAAVGAPKGKVNLNTATEAQLDALPGVGPVTAKAIVAWRSAHGKFTDITQLGDVDGIGPARLARLRDQVTI